MTCPSSPPSTPPTVGDDPYLGATITTYNASGQAVQVTNPLGGITLTSYDADGNVTQTTVESNNSTADPNVVTSYSYDADDQVTSTTVDPGGSPARHHRPGLRPRRQRLLQRLGQRRRCGRLPVPAVAARLGRQPAQPVVALLLDARLGPGRRRHHHLLRRRRRRAAEHQPRRRDHGHGATTPTGAPTARSDPTNVVRLAGGQPAGTYPYLCPAAPPATAPAPGSDPGYVTTIYDAGGQRAVVRPTRWATPRSTPTAPAARC